MGRSRPAPPFRTPEGAKLTTVLRSGHGSPLDKIAARTRSRDSRTAASGNPTMVNPGRPLETWTSTETALAVAPVRTAELTAACCTQMNGRPVPAMSPSVGYEGVPSGTTELPARLKTSRVMGYPVVWSCPALLNNVSHCQ